MEEIKINSTNGTATVSSLQIARDFDKLHKNVIRDIENIKAQFSALTQKLETQQNLTLPPIEKYFIDSTYKAGTGKNYKSYEVTRDGFMLLSMGFTGEKALALKIAYIEQFNAMEKELRKQEKLPYNNSGSITCENVFINNSIINVNPLKKDAFSASNERSADDMKKVSINQLKQGKIWCNWVWYTTKDNKKTKKPLSKVNDPSTWITYEDARKNTEWSKDEKGIGIMFAKNRSGLAICGIDIDSHHADKNPVASEIIAMFRDTYIEKSPSGKGYHILFFAELDKLPNAQSYKGKYLQKNSKLDVECYISGMTNRYFTFTGNQVSEGDCLTDKTDTLINFLDKYMLTNQDDTLKLTEGEDISAPIDVAKRLTKAIQAENGNKFAALYHGDTSGYNSTSEAVQALADMLVFWFGEGGQSLVKEVYMQSGLAVGKWAERSEIIDKTIENAFKRVSGRYTPHSGSSTNDTPKEEKAVKRQKKPVLEDYGQFERFIEENGYSVRYNQITHNFEFEGFDKGESTEHLAENVPSILRDSLKKQFSGVTRQSVLEYITRYATRHKFNPILNAIKSVKWDGKNYVGQIYDIFRIPADTEEGMYSRIFIQKWLMQCVCGLFNTIENPFSLDLVLVFIGRQGIGKTRFFEKLALNSKFFGEGMCLDPRDKDSIIQATSKWISELGEIGSTMKKDMDSVKAFITKSTDEYRTPYGKAPLHYPRITSFVGTVNDNEYLIDQTGNRRFLTVPLPPDLIIDYETQIKPFDALQLWAQVWYIVNSQEREISSCFRLTENEKNYLERRNSAFTKPMKGEMEVLDILEEQQTPQQGYICTFREMTVLQFIQLHNLKYDARAVGRVLKKYGYDSRLKRADGTVSRVIRFPHKQWQGNNEN